MKIHPVYFVKAYYRSYFEQFIYVYVNFLYLFKMSSLWRHLIDFSNPLVSLNPASPQLTAKLAFIFRYNAHIQSTTHEQNKVPILHFFFTLFFFNDDDTLHSDVYRYMEEKICLYLMYYHDFKM